MISGYVEKKLCDSVVRNCSELKSQEVFMNGNLAFGRCNTYFNVTFFSCLCIVQCHGYWPVWSINRDKQCFFKTCCPSVSFLFKEVLMSPGNTKVHTQSTEASRGPVWPVAPNSVIHQLLWPHLEFLLCCHCTFLFIYFSTKQKKWNQYFDKVSNRCCQVRCALYLISEYYRVISFG